MFLWIVSALAADAPPPLTFTGLMVDGPVPTPDVHHVLVRAEPGLRACLAPGADAAAPAPRTVALLWELTPTGAVALGSVAARPSTPEQAACLTAVLGATPFPAAAGASRVTAVLTVSAGASSPPPGWTSENAGVVGTLDPTLASAIGGLIGTTGVQQGASSAPTILGSLRKEEIDPVVKRGMGGMRTCYREALEKDREFQTRLVIKFVIAPDGGVSSAIVKSTTVGAPEFEACALRNVSALRFPAPAGGGSVIVSYPFSFTQS